MPVIAVGVNHRTAPVELREQLAVAGDRLPGLLSAMREELSLQEVALLSTCNRTEFYAVDADGRDLGARAAELLGWLARQRHIGGARLADSLYAHAGVDAVRHMMRVASGLDSMVLGEPQVFGQMKDAYAVAHQAGTVGKGLERAFQQVFAVAKQVRTETAIGASPVSMAFAAVSLAKHLFSDIGRTRALLIGAGEMIELVARHLAEQGVRGITVANRTIARAHALADRHGGRAITMDEISYALADADIVVSCTAAQVPVLGKGTVERALRKRRHRPLFIVDLAVPRDVEPEVAELEDVYLYTVDNLQGVIDGNVKAREAAARDAEAIVEARASQFEVQQREQGAGPTLRAVRARVEALRDTELERALADIRRGADPAATLQRLGHSLTNKILHEPSLALRQVAAEGREDLLAFARAMFAVVDEAADTAPDGTGDDDGTGGNLDRDRGPSA